MSTGTEVVVRYEPRGAAAELFRTRQSEVAIAGPAGTGKSLAALYRLHLAALNTPNIRCLVVRKTAVSLGSTTLVTFEKKVAGAAIKAGIVKWFGGSAREAASYRYSNGSTIVVGGMDNPDRVLSSEFDLILADECTELSETDWEVLGTRLRNGKLSWQQQIAACNPSAPNHWIKRRSERGTMKMLYSRHRDNPAYYNLDGTLTDAGTDYMGKLDSLTGVRRLRLRDGIWAAAEGVIYDGFDPAIHVVPKFVIPEQWQRFWSVDFGFVNPFVLQCYAEDPDGQLILYREIYRTKRTVDQHAVDIMECTSKPDPSWVSGKGDVASSGRIWTEPKPRAIVCDHDAESRAVLAKQLNLPTRAANKKVKDGIDRVTVRLRPRPDGRPGVVFMEDAVVHRDQDLVDAIKPASTVEEMPSYIWDIKDNGRTKDEPVKENDHGADGLRYMCQYRDPSARPGMRTT